MLKGGMVCVLGLGVIGCAASEPEPEPTVIVDRASAYEAAMRLVEVAAAASVSRDATVEAVNGWQRAELAIIAPIAIIDPKRHGGGFGTIDPILWPDVPCNGACEFAWNQMVLGRFFTGSSGEIVRDRDDLAIDASTSTSDYDIGGSSSGSQTRATFVVSDAEIRGASVAGGGATGAGGYEWRTEATYDLVRHDGTCLEGTIEISQLYTDRTHASESYDIAAVVELDDCAAP